MGLSKKRKQHLSLISARAAESHKHKRSIGKINKKRFLKKQREEEDFWDKFEELRSESSSDEFFFFCFRARNNVDQFKYAQAFYSKKMIPISKYVNIKMV